MGRIGLIARLAFTPRFVTLTLVCLVALSCLGAALVTAAWAAWTGFAFAGALAALGFRDLFNTHHAILRNYPIAAHLRFILEEVRPEIRQYFFEDEKHGMPFSRDRRAVVYQRAKMELDKRPFGTQNDVYADGFEWMHHSIAAREAPARDMRVRIGGDACVQPYEASLLNVSAMSFGALSANAIRALSGGARLGAFAQDTGEGGVSPYHREGGGDLIWELGSGYFGARTEGGAFCPERFAAIARSPQVKMVEVKLSQGAKPGHGGVLPAAKVSAEIAAIRGVRVGEDCISPPRHAAFDTPVGLLEFIARLRDLSGGKPAGFKLCIGHRWEFLAICKAMLATGILPDFIVIDGKEGGTGAAPMEFIDHLGMPMRDGLIFAHQALRGIGVRDKIRIGVSGKITTAFDMARAIALGADWCNSARGFMFALGCVQSLACHTDRCPTGVATQDPTRARALVVADKTQRVLHFHAATMAALAELTGAAGLAHARDFRCAHFSRRVGPVDVRPFTELYPQLPVGALIDGTDDSRFASAWALARADNFAPAG